MKKIFFNIILFASIFFFSNAFSQISCAQTINFDTADDTNLGPVANDGEGGSTAITGVQINITAINAAGTATGVDLVYNVTDVGFGVTKVTIGTGTGAFSKAITNLTANTKNSFKAYAINSKGLSYGMNKSFKTSTALSLEDLIFMN